jgi:putative ABC transport system permease protein
MTPRPEPLRILSASLRAVSSRDAASAAIGDLYEELEDRRRSGAAPAFPSLWLQIRLIAEIRAVLALKSPRTCRVLFLVGRDAARTIRRSPATSLFIMGVLAIGIAAGTLTYSVVDAVILKPLPIPDAHRVVYLPTQDFATRTTYINPDVYHQLHDRSRTLESMAVASVGTSQSSMLTVEGVSSSGPVTNATADVFRVLRLSVAVGRVWTPEEDAAAVDDVAVLGHRFWRERLGSDPAILGKRVTFSSKRAPVRIIGVLAEESDTPDFYLLDTAVWTPTAALRAKTGRLAIIARMRAGVTGSEVIAELQQFAGAPGWRPTVQPILAGYISQIRDWMLLALGAVGLVILIGCINAANVLLMRSAARAHELAIRSSLGASRRRIAGSVVLEGLLLSTGATIAALLFAIWGVRAAKVAMLASGFRVFRVDSIALNGRVLAAALTSAVVTGVVFSLVPAWQMSRTSILSLLKEGSAMGVGARGRWRSALLAAQISAVGVLLVISWMFVMSLIRVAGVNLGIDRSHLLAVHSNSSFNGTVDDLVVRAKGVSGVDDVAVAIGASLPLIGSAYGGAWGTLALSRANAPDGAAVEPLDYRVTPNYFSVAGIHFIRGGAWRPDEAAPLIVLDDMAARQLFGDEDPIGRQVNATQLKGIFTVIGVVTHVKALGAEGFADYGAAYTAIKPKPDRNFAGVFLRTSRPAAEMLEPVSEALRSFSTSTDLTKDPFVVRADDAVQRLTATRRFNATVLAMLGVLGALIGAAGIYAVMASVVVQRTREIGLRVALGATRTDIRRGILAMAIRHALAGLVIGLPMAWWLSRGFAAYLFQVTPTNMAAYVGVSVMLGLVAIAAALIPSRRAARVDPIICLRAQ